MQPPARFRPPVTTAYRSSRHETSEWQVTWQDTNSRSLGHVTTPTPAVGYVAAAASTSSVSPQRSSGAFPGAERPGGVSASARAEASSGPNGSLADAADVDVESVQRAVGGQEQAVAGAAAEGEVGASLGQVDVTVERALLLPLD